MKPVLHLRQALDNARAKCLSGKTSDCVRFVCLLAGAAGAARRKAPDFFLSLADFRGARRPALVVRGVLLTMALIVLWVCLADVDRVVRADARVIPAGRSQLIQHLEGGIVSSISVREGGVVKKGELLLTLSDTRADSMLVERQVKLLGLRARAARLRAESQGGDRVDFPEELAKAAKEADTERELFAVRRQKMQFEVGGAGDQLRQREAGLRELESRRRSLGAEMSVAQQQLAIMSKLIQKNAASQFELLEAEARASKLGTQIGDVESAIPKTRASIQEAQNRVQETMLRYRSDARAELVSADLEISRLEQEIRAESDRVDRTEIRAPVAGIVNRLYLNTVGGVVKSGEPIIELTPVDDRRILLEGSVRPSDRGELHLGLGANVRIAAYDHSVFGILRGKLTEISADTVTDERGGRHYRIQVEVAEVPASYRDKLIAPGMTATADVVTGRRTIFQYLVSPLNRFAYNAFQEPR